MINYYKHINNIFNNIIIIVIRWICLFNLFFASKTFWIAKKVKKIERRKNIYFL